MNWTQLASTEKLEKTQENLRNHNIESMVVNSGAEALAEIKKRIPAGAEVMTGSSTTLNQIGFSEYFESGDHGWRNMHHEITREDEDAKRSELRRSSVTADYYLASPNAISETGAIIAADATGSRVGAFPYAAKHLILVVGTHKIVPDIETGIQRVREHVFPLEDKRLLDAYGMNSSINKWAVIERETDPNRILVIFVNEVLGF
jgi:L-lactate utilization protein LutC